MPYRRPSDTVPNDWYKVAKIIDQNWATNKACQSAYWPSLPTTSHPVPCPTLAALTRTPLYVKPIPTDVDTSERKNPSPLTCYWCHKTRHKAPDCPDRFDIRALSIEELEMELMVRKDMAAVEEPTPELQKDFVQDNKWKACPHCPPVTVLKYTWFWNNVTRHAKPGRDSNPGSC